jgi:preprotein translocase subunit SecE
MPEMVEDKEKQGQPSPAPVAAPVKPGVRAELAAKAGVLLTSLSWGAALAFGLSSLPSMGGPVLTFPAAVLRPGGLVAGAGLAAFLVWLGLKRFGANLRYAKPGQGRWVRGIGLTTVAGLAGFGAAAFYMLPSYQSLWWADLWRGSVLGISVALKPILFGSLGVFGTVTLVAYALSNRESWAEFLIETEGEVKKVSWPARKEYLGSALVVVLVIAIVSLFLWAADEGLSQVMKRLKIGF